MIFKSDSYDTPLDKKRCICDRLALGSRWYFYWKYFLIIFSTNRAVENDVLVDEEYCKTADQTFELLENCGAKIHAKGIDNIKKESGPVVFICNHMSILETFILPAFIIPINSVSFIVKESLTKHRLFGKIMRSTLPISVTRKDPMADYKKVMSEGKKMLDSGRSIIVFPQKTRGSNFIADEFGTIGEKLAGKAGVPIVPVALKTDFWGNGKYFKDFGKIHRNKDVHFEFGVPFKLDSPADKSGHPKIVSFIEERLNKWNSV